MFLPLVFRLMILLSSLTLVKPDCQTRCGNVDIPYPFGIFGDGGDCYIDDWFAVECKSGKPFLKNFNLQVLDISFKKSTVVVNHAVNKTCHWNDDMGAEVQKSANLTSSPFVFSRAENVLTGLGCDNFARIFDNGTVAACYSSCGLPDKNTTEETTGCFGTKCCQTIIPLVLQVFSTDALPIKGNYENVCKQAFVAQKEWLDGMIGSPEFTNGNFTSVPVVLKWGIQDNDRVGKVNLSGSASCEVSPDFSRTGLTSSSVFQCQCRSGYEGNPYDLSQGCQDIDECKDETKKNCEPNMICVNLLGSFHCHNPRPKIKIIMIISGIAIGIFCLLSLIGAWWAYILIKKRKDMELKKKYFKRNGGLLLQQQLTSFDGNVDRSKLFTSEELDKATDHFNVNRILGQGGQGTVYKGMLTDGKIIAVKKSKVIDEGKVEGFINEVAILSQINHRNVVKLLGCCLETEVPLLVYEFIPNGTLFQYLYDQIEELSLTWEMRLQIATEVAGALFYLHSAASLPIYHRDIKSANILLDSKYRAKLADFGTSKSLSIDQTHVTTKVQGTFGYLDPEYFQSSQFTDKSDVYSFGVVLVELLTGQKPISSTRSPDKKSLATYFIFSMQENNLFNILDPEVMKGKKEDIVTIAELAKRCLNLNGKKRPTMKEVAMVLEGIQASQKHSNVASTSKFSTFEEVEYVRTELIEPWDVVSNPTSSTF